MLTAFWQEARGLQVIECPTAWALDLQFGKAAGGGEFAGAVAAAYVLQGQVHLSVRAYRPDDVRG